MLNEVKHLILGKEGCILYQERYTSFPAVTRNYMPDKIHRNQDASLSKSSC
jgi:hypothetical protein